MSPSEQTGVPALPVFTYMGGYPLVYYTKRFEPMCAHCASWSEPGGAEHVDVYWEGEPLECEGCGVEIESAYGCPERPGPPAPIDPTHLG